MSQCQNQFKIHFMTGLPYEYTLSIARPKSESSATPRRFRHAMAVHGDCGSLPIFLLTISFFSLSPESNFQRLFQWNYVCSRFSAFINRQAVSSLLLFELIGRVYPKIMAVQMFFGSFPPQFSEFFSYPRSGSFSFQSRW
jgi:hypothetical protein